MIPAYVRPIALFSLVAGVFGFASVVAPAQSGSFDVAQNGHAVGTASFQFTATPQGYDSASMVRMAMKGLDYALSKTEQLSSANHLKHVQLSATVNGSAVNVVAAPDAAEQILLNTSADGHSTTTRLDGHAGAVFLPDFDPGALASYADQQGTLDGKAIAVHHLVATIAGADTDLFSGPEDQLLQAELPQQGFALVRKGFVLTPPAKPIAPPE